MTNFDMKRFGRVLKWSAVMTRKEMLTNAAAMFFAMFLPFIIQMTAGYRSPEAVVAAGINTAMQTDIFIYFIIVMIGGCRLFSNMNTKEQRITFRMLPATDLEKFAVRALYVTVAWWVMALAAFCLADVCRMLISLTVGIDVVGSAIPGFIGHVFGGGWDDAFTVNGSSESAALAAVAVTAAWLFFVHSLYALGGAFFRRRQFVLTSITVCILGFIGSILFVHFVDNFHADFQLSWITALAWTGTAVFAALGLLDWWLAYWIFRRMQAVNNKWVNL